QLIFDIVSLAGMTATDPRTQVFELYDDTKDSLCFKPMFANRGGITSVVSQQNPEESRGEFSKILAKQILGGVVADDRVGESGSVKFEAPHRRAGVMVGMSHDVVFDIDRFAIGGRTFHRID